MITAEFVIIGVKDGSVSIEGLDDITKKEALTILRLARHGAKDLDWFLYERIDNVQEEDTASASKGSST